MIGPEQSLSSSSAGKVWKPVTDLPAVNELQSMAIASLLESLKAYHYPNVFGRPAESPCSGRVGGAMVHSSEFSHRGPSCLVLMGTCQWHNEDGLA